MHALSRTHPPTHPPTAVVVDEEAALHEDLQLARRQRGHALLFVGLLVCLFGWLVVCLFCGGFGLERVHLSADLGFGSNKAVLFDR